MSSTQRTIYTRFHKYQYTGDVTEKRQRAIIDSICYLGWMSLKDSDWSVSGPNQATVKRNLTEAKETRAAADVLLKAGVVTLLGTWSNGIAVGPGPDFVALTDVQPVAPVKQARTRKPRLNSNTGINPLTGRSRAIEAQEMAAARAQEEMDTLIMRALDGRPDAMRLFDARWQSGTQTRDRMIARIHLIVADGADRPMRYREGACCPVTLAPVSKPRVRVPVTLVAAASLAPAQAYTVRYTHNGTERQLDTIYDTPATAYDVCTALLVSRRASEAWYAPVTPSAVQSVQSDMQTDDADAIADAKIAAITGEEYTAPAYVPYEVKRVESGAFNFVLYRDGAIRISNNGRFIEEPSDKLYAEATAALKAAPAPVTPVTPAPVTPAPVTPAPVTLPAKGDVVRITYRHEDGRTTERIVDVQRVGNDRALGPMFRGYDRTYNRTRNYYLRHIVHIAWPDGKEVSAA